MARSIKPTSVDSVVIAAIVIFSIAFLSYLGVGIYALTLDHPPVDQSAVFNQQVTDCQASYSGDQLMDCIDAAQLASCQFEPLPTDHPDFDPLVDGRCSLSR